MKKIQLPLQENDINTLRAGDMVLLNGVLYTGRDAAHKRLTETLQAEKTLPFAIKGEAIYYVGPTPAPPGYAVGAAGPTTSYRMDSYAPLLIKEGLRGMIGKGIRSQEVIEAMKACGAVYFGATGGAGALLAKCIQKSEIIAYEDLGTEAIHRFTVEDFPVVVLIDALGNNLYERA
ncbi:MAG: Fe-S-containing hydro-lyase [Christensenellaceae bacterium]|jgi:fumarate hydratase subunit beta